MGWPLKFRSLSFAITFAVVMIQCALWAVPIGLGLWYWGAAAPSSIIAWVFWISLAVSLVIAGQAHVTAPRYSADPRGRSQEV